jgi:protein-L-isoaspartate(D-aspartate) O-methyltransferase
VLPFLRSHLPDGFRDDRVFDAMERVPRAKFVPAHLQEEANLDVALPIGLGQTISQPFIVAYMTAGLKVGPGAKVLEVGTGSGYQAAVLATMGVDVYTVEVIAELTRRAQTTLGELKLQDRARFRVGDGWHGWPSAAPFDGIICTAAPARIPPALIEQLAPGARLVIPIGARESQVLHVLERRGQGLEEVARLAVRFVPLVRAAAEG